MYNNDQLLKRNILDNNLPKLLSHRCRPLPTSAVFRDILDEKRDYDVISFHVTS